MIMSNQVSKLPQFCPSAFYSGIVRIDSPARQSMLIYDHDKKFFAQNRKRKLIFVCAALENLD